MGWLWSSSTPPVASTSKQETNVPPGPSSTPTSTSTTSIPESSKTPTRDELADRELSAFLDSINSEVNAPPKEPIYVRRPKRSSTSQTPNTNEPISEALLPTEMSCRQAFDSAFYCSSFGGHFMHLYRYGGMRSCSEHWDDFWFCMRTRGYGGPAKEKAIRDHYRLKERTKYGKDEEGNRRESSEDVWKSRETMVEKGTAFRGDWGEVERSINGSKAE